LGNWRKVFLISAAFYAGGSLFFALFAGGEIEPWNGHEDVDEEDDRKINSSSVSSPLPYKG